MPGRGEEEWVPSIGCFFIWDKKALGGSHRADSEPTGSPKKTKPLKPLGRNINADTQVSININLIFPSMLNARLWGGWEVVGCHKNIPV